jgi:hypothetical protein
MTAREDPTMAAEAQSKALTAIAALRAERTAEGLSEAEIEMTKALAERVCQERLTTDQVVGTTKGGRLMVEPGPQGPATAHFFTHVMKPMKEPTIHGGPHQEGATTS